jgi:hypothetical protein
MGSITIVSAFLVKADQVSIKSLGSMKDMPYILTRLQFADITL